MKSALTLLTALLSITGLAACSKTSEASASNFKQVLEQHFENHGDLCIGRHQWPVDVPDLPDAKKRLRDAIQMPALEKAGIVAHSDTTMTLKHQNGSEEKVAAFRYELTEQGRALINQHPKTAARNAQAALPDICYGHVHLAQISGWDKPQPSEDHAGQLSTTVRYTYQIDVAPWAKLPDVQAAFPLLARVVKGHQSMELSQELLLDQKGWRVL